MQFSHEGLEKELNEVLLSALDYVHNLDKTVVLNCDPACVSEIIRMFLVVVPELGEFFVEKDVIEDTNVFSSRKTGGTQLIAYISIHGDKRWVFKYIRDQIVDEYPLAFAKDEGIRIVVSYIPDQEDSDTLKEKFLHKKDLVFQYVASVKEIVEKFNENLTKKIISALDKRRETIWKTYSALEATRLPAVETNLRQRQDEQNERVLKMLSAVLGPQQNDKKTQETNARIFIVHGHDNDTKLQLKNYIQNTLKLGEPLILHEHASLGRTLIEKFEHLAKEIDLVFVLLTPDDKGASIEDSESEKARARQNVIFEMGYFLGKLERESGRVLLLHKGQLEIPSDIYGVVYIDISNGIESAGESIRRELKALGYLG